MDPLLLVVDGQSLISYRFQNGWLITVGCAVVEELKPESVSQLSDGSHLYKFKKNFVGTVRLAALPAAEAGSNISILAGEWLSEVPSPYDTYAIFVCRICM